MCGRLGGDGKRRLAPESLESVSQFHDVLPGCDWIEGVWQEVDVISSGGEADERPPAAWWRSLDGLNTLCTRAVNPGEVRPGELKASQNFRFLNIRG
jgi:hypothetical protein